MLQRLARVALTHAGARGGAATVAAGGLARSMSRTLAVRSVPPGVLQHARLISASALQNVTRLVTEANKPSALLDADLQANVLRELNRYSLPKEVIRRYESNMIAKSEDAKREYIKALASLNLLDSSKLLSVLGRGGNQADYNSAFFQQPLTIAAPAPASPPMPIPLPVQVQVSMWQRVGSILMIGAVLYFVARPFLNKGEEGSGSGKMGDLLAKPKAHHRAERVTTKFADVKGINEVKNDLMDIVEYLRHPGKFEKMGAKLPKGILLYGPPGTGKTLLARAVAGEAGVPFFYCSGSEFDEIFVGVGSKRVRNLFAEAKKQAPCIVFIDEIDSLAPARRAQVTNYRDGTINQLLSELDGFAPNDGVILIGATNLPESLDPALMRPGRFDKHIPVMKPDVAGRKEILELYLGKVTHVASDVDIPKLARATPGLTGADLANLVNLAAIKAATRNLPGVTQRLLEEAFDDVLMGSERKSVVLTEDSRRLTAYHEGGHALVSIYTPGSEPIRKITIVPRGQSLGMVASMPARDETSYNRQQMMARLAVALGGRAAEHLIFGEDKVTSGASSDFKSATMLAQSMVSKWGMSGRAGFMYHDDQEKMSTDSLRVMEEEVNSLLQQQYQLATKIISERRGELERLVVALLEHETLTGEEVALVIAGKPLPKAVVSTTSTTTAAAASPAPAAAPAAAAAAATSSRPPSSPVVIRK